MSFFGYDVPAEKMEEAKKDLMTTDARSKAILAEIQQPAWRRSRATGCWWPTPTRSPCCYG